MLDGELDWQQLVQGLRDGNGQVIRWFCDAYGPMLQKVAGKRLPREVRRRVGPEDVVQSACRTFFRRFKGGQFEVADSEKLWHLLCAITLTKVREKARYHHRKKRALGKEVAMGPAVGDSSGPGFQPPAVEP